MSESQPVRYVIEETEGDSIPTKLIVENAQSDPIVQQSDPIKDFIAATKPHLVIMTPCYNSSMYVGYTQSLIATLFLCKENGIEANVVFCRNDSLVSRARNNLVAKAMYNKSATHFLFIDADITWNPIDVVKLIVADKHIVGGIYPIKNYNWDGLMNNHPRNSIEAIKSRYETSIFKNRLSLPEFTKMNMVRYNINHESNTLNVEKNLTKVRHLATGFMMIKRQTFDMMFKAFSHTKYTDDVSFLEGDENLNAYALFDCGVENDHYFSEDWMFCDRWRKMGGEIYVDVTISLDHTGIETFSGCFLSSVA
jgi:hypothetical protein